MNISVPRERRPGENRVGLTPAAVELLTSDVHLLASHGTETAIAECHPLARGVATHDGKIVSSVLQKPPEQRETDVMEAVH